MQSKTITYIRSVSFFPVVDMLAMAPGP